MRVDLSIALTLSRWLIAGCALCRLIVSWIDTLTDNSHSCQTVSTHSWPASVIHMKTHKNTYTHTHTHASVSHRIAGYAKESMIDQSNTRVGRAGGYAISRKHTHTRRQTVEGREEARQAGREATRRGKK